MESIVQLIDQWNSSRLELFKISKPDKNNIFQGVMRFFYESNDKYHSKCVRVSSEMSVRYLVPLLWEKFSVLTRRVRMRDIRLYERCGIIDKMLSLDERPLLIQLCWCKDDKEGIFVLRSALNERETKTKRDTVCAPSSSCMDSNGNPCLTKYCDDDTTRTSPSSLSLNPANSYLSRTISNPESLMRLRRKTKLESKLHQIFRSGDFNGGGTLKIYGDSINAMIPYKSLLLSIDDTAAYVVREILDKYGLGKEDANDYCLLKIANGTEEILQKNDSPLRALLGAVQDPCFIKFKVVKCPPHLRKRNKSKGRTERVHVIEDVNKSQAPLRSKFDTLPKEISRHNITVDSGIESQQSCSHSVIYRSDEQLPIYDAVNNNIYSTPPFTRALATERRVDSDSRPLPSYEESVQRSRLIKSLPMAQKQLLSPFGESIDSFSFSSDCMEDLSSNDTGSVNGSTHNIDDIYKINSKDTDLSMVSDLDAQLSRHLPVQITYFKSKEDLLLDSLILEIKPSQIKFKLSLAYVLHLMVVDIIRLTCINKTTTADQELIIGNFIEKVTAKIRQSVMQNRSRISIQTFWLANCTEFLYLLKNNPLLCRLNTDHFQRFYELFADNTQCCFQYISCCFKDDVVNTLSVLLLEHSDDDDDKDKVPLSKKAHNPRVMSDLIRTLSSCMSVLQQCHVNSALIIQIMSRIFHLINCWIFNQFIENKCLISQYWAAIIANRVDRIRQWSAAHDLLLAADCYLQKCIQMCRLIMIEKTDVEVLYNETVDLVQINSVQLRHFLENYTYIADEPHVPQIWIDFVTSGVAQVADKIFEEEGVDVALREVEDLDLPLLLPDDGYHVDTLFGAIPDGFIEYLNELHREWCFYKISHQTIHFDWLCRKVPNKEMVAESMTTVNERINVEPAQSELVDNTKGHARNRHQLKLSDFKANISGVNSGVDTHRMQRFFQSEPYYQEKTTAQECDQNPEKMIALDNCSTYASSFSTEIVDDSEDHHNHNDEELLLSIRTVKSTVDAICKEDAVCQEQLQCMVTDLNKVYDVKLQNLMADFERDKNGDMFRMNYKQMRLAERRDEVFQKYRKQKETDSNLETRRMQIIPDIETPYKRYYPSSNTFPGYESQAPVSFVSTSVALRNTLNYPPKVKPKPRTCGITWRSRSQSVVSICQQDSGLSTLCDVKPRSKSGDRYYSRTFDGLENLTFQEKLDMFEYGVFTTSH